MSDGGRETPRRQEGCPSDSSNEVSPPSRNWLAWFQRLPPPSPDSHSRKQTASPSLNCGITLQEKGLQNPTCSTPNDLAAVNLPKTVIDENQLPLEKFPEAADAAAHACEYENEAMSAALTQDGMPAKHPLPLAVTKGDVLETEGSTIATTGEMEGSNNAGGGDSSAETKSDLHSDNHHPWKAACYRWCCISIQHHPYITSLLVTLFLVFVTGSIMFCFLWLFPFILQTTLDAATLTMQRAMLTDPHTTSFQLEVELLLQRFRGSSRQVTLESFPVQVFYVPNSKFSLVSRPMRTLEHNDYHFVKNESAETTARTTVLLRDSREQRRLDTRVVELPQNRYGVGAMMIPTSTLSGRSSKIHYKTTFTVENQAVFDGFLRELLTEGRAKWSLEGSPIAHLFGIPYRNIHFRKVLELAGPVLAHPPEKLETLLDAHDESDVGDEATTALSSAFDTDMQLSKTTTPPSDNFMILSIDMTNSTSTNVSLALVVLLINESPKAVTVVDPVGKMTIAGFFEGVQIIELYSSDNITLLPGLNQVRLEGTLQLLDEGSVTYRNAVTELITTIAQGRVPTLEAKGVSCSIRLYEAAATTLHLYAPLQLTDSKRGSRPPDVTVETDDDSAAMTSTTTGAGKPTTPFLRDMELLDMQLFPKPDSDTDLVLHATATLFVANPFGPNGKLQLQEIHLRGDLAFEPNDAAHDDDKGLVTMAHFIGKATSTSTISNATSPSTRHRSTIGPLAVELQQLTLKLEMELTLLHDGQDFTAFIRQLLEEASTLMSLTQVHAFVTLDTPLGIISVHHIPIHQDIVMVGFAGFKNIHFARLSFGNLISMLNPFARGGRQRGLDITVSVVIPSESVVTIMLGTLAVELRYRGEHLAYMTAADCVLQPGTNTFNFTGTIRLRDPRTTHLLPLIANYFAGHNSILQARFIPLSDTIPPNDDYDSHQQNTAVPFSLENTMPHWLEDALVGLEFAVPLPGLASHESSSLTEDSNGPTNPTQPPGALPVRDTEDVLTYETTTLFPREETNDDSLLSGHRRPGGLMQTILGGVQTLLANNRPYN